MPAVLLFQPPDSTGLWIPPGALGNGVKIVYTPGRNDGSDYPYGRKVRDIITTEASHTMGGPNTETPQSFANGEMGSGATLAEVATFPAEASPWGVPTLLQSLPLECMGVGSVALTPWGLTHESAELRGDPNAQPWTPDHIDLKARLTAWMIRNPLAAAGDRRWNKLQIRYQVCQSPYPNTAALGGLGFHTMWGDCGLQAGGTNPWSLYCKSCPGYFRRGYPAGKFPGVDDLSSLPGNFRDYYYRVGALLGTTNPEEDDLTPEQAAQLQALYDVACPRPPGVEGGWKPPIWTQTAVGIPTQVADLTKMVDALSAKVDSTVTAVAALAAQIEEALANGLPVDLSNVTFPEYVPKAPTP